MAWNEPGSQGNKDNNNNNNGNKDPWSGKPKQPGPPDLEAILRKLRQQAMQFFTGKVKVGNGNGGNRPASKIGGVMGLSAIALGIVVLWFLWGFFIVQPTQQAVVLRFGRYVDTVNPGSHWIPRLFESAYLVDKTISTYRYDAEMLTKDENIVSVAVAVQYQVDDVRNYLFSVANPQESLQQATASALRQVIGQTDLNQVLTSGREQIRQQVQQQIISTLARYNTGLVVTDVALQPAKAPEEVKDAFDDAIKAQEDEQRYESQAQAYAMQVEPIAKGQAQRLLSEAKAYQQQAVLHAKADVLLFLALLPQYQKAPGVMRERLYLETIENVLANNSKVLVDSKQGGNVFYLPVDKLLPPTMMKNPPANTTTSANTVTVDTQADGANVSTNTTYGQGGY